MSSSNPFKVGDRVKCVNICIWNRPGQVASSYADFLNAKGVVRECHDEWVIVEFDNHAGRHEMFFDRFVNADPPKAYKLDLEFENVDDAIAAATQFAKTLNRPVGVVNVY